MEYLAAIFGLAVMCGCALGAYGLLDAIEREDEASTRAAERGPSRLGRQVVAAGDTETPRALAAGQPWNSVLAHADWLDGQVRDLEQRLDQLVRKGPRVEAVRIN